MVGRNGEIWALLHPDPIYRKFNCRLRLALGWPRRPSGTTRFHTLASCLVRSVPPPPSEVSAIRKSLFDGLFCCPFLKIGTRGKRDVSLFAENYQK